MPQNTSHAVMAQRHISRKEAIDLGLKWYFTGEPCSRGHIAKRSVSNYDCRGCVNQRSAELRAAGGFVALDKNRYARDVEGNRAKSKINRLNHIEARRAYDKRRYHENSDRRDWQKSQARSWAKKNKGKRNCMIAARRSWVKRATPEWLTVDQVAQIRAVYMLAKELGDGLHVDHIVPLRGKNFCGLHVPWNLQIIPAVDNIKKGNRYEA